MPVLAFAETAMVEAAMAVIIVSAAATVACSIVARIVAMANRLAAAKPVVVTHALAAVVLAVTAVQVL